MNRRVLLSLLGTFVAEYGAAQSPAPAPLPPADTGERVPLHTVVPAYPEKARRARVEGEVEVCFNVTRDGKTHRVAVRRSTNRVFERPSRQAVRESTYLPLPPGMPLSGIKTCRTFRFFLTPVAIDNVED